MISIDLKKEGIYYSKESNNSCSSMYFGSRSILWSKK